MILSKSFQSLLPALAASTAVLLSSPAFAVFRKSAPKAGGVRQKPT